MGGGESGAKVVEEGLVGGREKVEEMGGSREEEVEEREGGAEWWRPVVRLKAGQRRRLSFWSSLVGVGEVVGTGCRAVGSWVGGEEWREGEWAWLRRLAWAELGLWVAGAVVSAVAWLLRAPYRGWRVGGGVPWAVYALSLLQLLLSLASCALLAAVLAAEPRLPLPGGPRLHRLQRALDCCHPLTNLSALPSPPACPLAGEQRRYVPFSCCAAGRPDCGQCLAESRGHPLHDCAPRLARRLHDFALHFLLLTLPFLPLHLGQLLSFRVLHTALHLAYQLRQPGGPSLGWLFSPPADLLQRARQHLQAPPPASPDPLQGPQPPHLPSLASPASFPGIQLAAAVKDSTEWNERWHSLLFDSVDQCPTDYEAEEALPGPASPTPAPLFPSPSRRSQETSRRLITTDRTARLPITPTASLARPPPSTPSTSVAPLHTAVPIPSPTSAAPSAASLSIPVPPSSVLLSVELPPKPTSHPNPS